MTNLRVPVSESDHTRGNHHAPVTLVEYGDYECVQCGRAFPIVERLRGHFGSKLLFVFRHFPLTQVHPLAESAAETAEFAGLYGKFWQMHDALFINQDQLGMPLLFAMAGVLDLPQTTLHDALAAGLCAAKVQGDFLGGVRSGVNGTPTFFINGARHEASYDFGTLATAIDFALVEAEGSFFHR
jgi:protein-disulfide isomerase